MQNYQNFKKGFTAVEILLVLGVLAVIFAVVIPQLSRSRENQVLKSAASDVLTALGKAQSETLASVSSSSYGVHFQSDKVIIFTGTTYSAGTASNETINVISPASITNVTLAGASGVSGDVYFNRLSGTPSKTGTVTISTSSYAKIITISATGATSVN